MRHRLFFPTVISRVFEPFVLLFAVTYIGATKTGGLTGVNLFHFLTAVVCVAIVPPLSLLFFAVRKHWVTNWDVSDRKQRVRVLGVFVLFILLDILLERLYFHNSGIERLFLLYIVWFTGFFLITLFFKLSGHTGIATLTAGLCVIWFGTPALVLFLFLPIIAWARVVGKKHSPVQTVGGIIYSLTILYFAIKSGIL